MKTASSYNWSAQREQKAFLALENGHIFHGYSIGAPIDAPGELIFNTNTTGHQEALSDPSCIGQIICLTTPETGIPGTTPEDMESNSFHAAGLLVHRISNASNWRSQDNLTTTLVEQNTPALAGIDTRSLTALIRDTGPMKAFLSTTGTVSESEAVEKARQWTGPDGQDYTTKVTCEKQYRWDPDNSMTATFPHAGTIVPPADYWVVAYDFGVKRNVLRGLRRAGMSVTVVPATTPAREVLEMKPDGVFLSNGPGDPAAADYAVNTVQQLLGKIPLMGICLGHQLLGIALGGKTCKLPFGHHGSNHPVQDLRRNNTLITSQNHNYALQADSLPDSEVEITHINLNDNSVEGIRARNHAAFSVQFYPDATPGLRDSENIFDHFYSVIRGTSGSSRRIFGKRQ